MRVEHNMEHTTDCSSNYGTPFTRGLCGQDRSPLRSHCEVLVDISCAAVDSRGCGGGLSAADGRDRLHRIWDGNGVREFSSFQARVKVASSEAAHSSAEGWLWTATRAAASCRTESRSLLLWRQRVTRKEVDRNNGSTRQARIAGVIEKSATCSLPSFSAAFRRTTLASPRPLIRGRSAISRWKGPATATNPRLPSRSSFPYSQHPGQAPIILRFTPDETVREMVA